MTSIVTTWYDDLRTRYRPRRVEVLLVAESPPDPGAGERRFFYGPSLTADNLFRGVALAAFGLDKAALPRTSKVAVLERLRATGVWLIDAVDEPINYLDGRPRRDAIRSAVPGLIARCQEAAPAVGVFVCKAPVYDLVAPGLRAAGLTVLNRTPAPFPLGNTRTQFVECWRRDVTPLLGDLTTSPSTPSVDDSSAGAKE